MSESNIKHRYRCDVCGNIVLIRGDQRLKVKSCPGSICVGELQRISGPPPAQADRSPSPAPQVRRRFFRR